MIEFLAYFFELFLEACLRKNGWNLKSCFSEKPKICCLCERMDVWEMCKNCARVCEYVREVCVCVCECVWVWIQHLMLTSPSLLEKRSYFFQQFKYRWFSGLKIGFTFMFCEWWAALKVGQGIGSFVERQIQTFFKLSLNHLKADYLIE